MVVWQVPCESRSSPSLSFRTHPSCLGWVFYCVDFMDQLRQRLHTLFPDLNLYLFDRLPSTSGYLVSHKHELSYPALCYTPHQTAGKGTFQKVWSSPTQSLTFSLALKIPSTLNELSAFSTLVGLNVIQVLDALGLKQSFRLKWPNDIFDDHGKVGGVLIEVLQSDANACVLSIGIGLNFSRIVLEDHSADYTSSFIEFNSPLRVLEYLIEVLLRFQHRESFLLTPDELQYAQSKDYFTFHEEITLLNRDTGDSLDAIYCGLQDNGVCLVSRAGQLQVLSSANMSIRKK